MYKAKIIVILMLMASATSAFARSHPSSSSNTRQNNAVQALAKTGSCLHANSSIRTGGPQQAFQKFAALGFDNSGRSNERLKQKSKVTR